MSHPTRRDGLRMWWCKFDQVVQLCEVLGKNVTQVVDHYVANSPVDEFRQVPIAFEEYLMHLATSQEPGLLRLCPRPFFELMDVAALMEGNRETRNRESWVRAVPHMVPLCGTSGVAGLVFDEIVKDLDCTEMTSSTFESFVEALYKVEFAINVDEPWALIKEHSGIRSEEKCILHTGYAADCSQFPPAVGGLYMSANHLVFQDPVLHNRRVISLHKVTEVKRVPVELRQARMLLSHLPGMGALLTGKSSGIMGGLLRLAGVKGQLDLPAAALDPSRAAGSTKSPMGLSSSGGEEEAPSIQRGGGDPVGRTGSSDSGAGQGKGVLGMTAIQLRWPGGGMARFQFVELSGALNRVWVRHLSEMVLAHKLAEAKHETLRKTLPLNVVFDTDKVPWLPSFVGENVLAYQALEQILGRESPSMLICTANTRDAGGPGDADGGGFVRELYTTYKASERYRRDEESLNCVQESFNFKTLDDNLQKLDDQTAELLELLLAMDRLTSWERPLHSLAAFSGCLIVFYYDAVWLVLPGVLLSVAGQAAYTGLVGKLWPSFRARAGRLLSLEKPSSPAETGNKPAPADSAATRRRNSASSADSTAAAAKAKAKASPPTSPRGATARSLDASFGAKRDLRNRFESASDALGGAHREALLAEASPPLSPRVGGADGAEMTPSKGWLQRLGEGGAVVQRLGSLRQNVRKMVEDNIVQVEKQLQVGLSIGREKTQKLSLLQNGIQRVNRLLEKLRVLHSWEHPVQSINYVIAVTALGATLAVIPVRWIFMGAVLGKFAPGDTMSRRLKSIGLWMARRYLNPPEKDDKGGEKTAAEGSFKATGSAQ